ncbi:uncharacterized protein T551_01725 [Pneumocystis jirovecii RU7]|uniref:CBF1-interacting co-repressor CIR N-terminal domain-containing protein n=1 Tax=Pneumocystis jirovecii (strain RU7) TaxID=1408657 RepID=A0A0W4ZPZ2_PNEJ7|nr:uncharacterized protein T551_01725 [Pneumocystis jirovecii RU7]KTW30442.1 hypothetical protein T551_01725 [Pneumocystis jirovecii RU7]
MPLNILKHKSWNVYNKSNIERVWRDEMLAKKKEEDNEMRIREADAERRLKILRERSELRKDSMNEDWKERIQKDISDSHFISNEYAKNADVDHLSLKNEKKRKKDDTIMLNKELKKKCEVSLDNKHINFWEDLESGKVSMDYKNLEYEKEKEDIDKKWKDVICMRLNNSANEMSPWYSHSSLQSSTQRHKDLQSIERNLKIQNSIKDFNDPLTVIQTCLKQKKKIKELKFNKKESCYSSNPSRAFEMNESLRKQKNYKDINEDSKALRGVWLSKENKKK